MQVKQILDKICEQNESIYGALVRSHDRTFHNFSGIYEMVDVDSITDMAEQALMLTKSLEAGDSEFNSVFFEYEQHSLFVRQIDAGLFILLTAPMERAVYRKTKIGVNLFIKKLCKALNESPLNEDTASKAVNGSEPINGSVATNGSAAEPIIAVRDQAGAKPSAEPTSEEEPAKKKRFYRGQFY
ncbi:hypothetical protein ACFO4O_12985 [Glaciecola siphonariae]|uniref:Roadblock/LAMTOR2 domain-containing protein n=1 Tax=Glaciecola siphonariae TaxID=521012 RepID=A0ABV9LX21_9ALTE